MADVGQVVALVQYYARRSYYRHIIQTCNEYLQGKGFDPIVDFWRLYGVAHEGHASEALTGYKQLQQYDDVKQCVTEAMLYTHQHLCKVVDAEEVSSLEAFVEVGEESASEISLYHGALYHMHVKDLGRATALLAKLAKCESEVSTANALVVGGWLSLFGAAAKRGVSIDVKNFTKVDTKKGNVDAAMGLVEALVRRKQYAKALETINNVIVNDAWYSPAVVEKANVYIATGDWEQAMESVSRILSDRPRDVDGLRISALNLLAREGKSAKAANMLHELAEVLDQCEPNNASLMYRTGAVCARISAREPGVLQGCLTLIDRALKLQPDKPDYHCEQGYIYLLLGESRSASVAYNKALKLASEGESSSSSTQPLIGILRCHVLNDQLEEAQGQLEFLYEIELDDVKSAELLLLDSILKDKTRGLATDIEDLLLKAASSHLKDVKKAQGGPVDSLITRNPELMLEIAKEMLKRIPSEPLESGQSGGPLLDSLSDLLESVTHLTPGLLEAQQLLAKVNCIQNDFANATRILTACLRLNPSYADAHLLFSQIYLRQERYTQALQSLEQALSLDFQVRESPVYHVAKAKCLAAVGEMEQAAKILEGAMNLPGVKRAATEGSKRGKKSQQLSIHDRASVYLETVHVYLALNKKDEATAVMQSAINEFSGTSEEVRVTIANCDLALKKGDVQQALGMLQAIKSDSPHYLRSRMAMAKIYLEYRNDPRMYAECYKEIAQDSRFRGPRTMIMLGEALLAIQDPEGAIEAYQEALKENPGDVSLATKIGTALVQTHNYSRAIDYYEEAVKKDPSKLPLRYDLAELYVKLRHYSPAEKSIMGTLEANRNPEDLHSLMINVKLYQLLAQVAKECGDSEKWSQNLLKAKEDQATVLSHLRGEHREVVQQQKEVAANLCYQLAEMHANRRDIEKAQQFYNDALKHQEHHEKSMIALARLYLAKDELDRCREQCVQLTRFDPGNQEASMMLADILFRKSEFDQAIYHFEQILERRANNYICLMRLIELLRKAGKLGDAPRFLKLAEKATPRAVADPGLHFCKGLYNRYTNNPREALKEFNFARRDAEWGNNALLHMVEIYLNPDNETVWAQDSDSNSGQNAEAAQKLLTEYQTEKPFKKQILEANALIATKQKPQIERALQQFAEVLQSDRDNVPCLLGMAQAFMALKQTPKARNQLKRIVKLPVTPDEAEEFERSYLLLAELYMGNGKYDLAQDLCRKCLAANKSCGKAWEFMGIIMEEEKSYADAAGHYENAWRFEHESNAGIGYRLAFNYLKANRNVEAIDVCHKVLKIKPDYPKIKKEILDKARQALRP